jgi:O-6-methylguanine DNA methyltransferase
VSTRTITAGPLSVTARLDDSGRLIAVDIPQKVPAGLESKHLAAVLKQLGEFQIEYPDYGPFVRKTWEQMRKIPWGKALTYGELATAIGSPAASRAVGQACARNELLLIIPCHRVLAQTGLGGFACGLEWKSALLALETEAL